MKNASRKNSSNTNPFQLHLEPLEDRVMLSSADPGTRIRVDAIGETAEEILQLQIDGQAVQDFTFANAGQEQILLFETNEVIDSSRVNLVFLNDSLDPATGFDRNVDVSQFQVIDLESDSREIFNIGTAEGSLAFTGDNLNVANSGTVASSPDASLLLLGLLLYKPILELEFVSMLKVKQEKKSFSFESMDERFKILPFQHPDKRKSFCSRPTK